MQKKLLAAAIASAMCAPIAAEAVTVKFSGHVNRLIRWLDDGVASDIQHTDHSGSRSRIRWAGSEKFGNATAGVYLEAAFAPHVNAGAGKAVKAKDGGSNFSIRHTNLWFSGTWGRVNAGLTVNSMAAIDLSGNSAYAPPGVNNLHGTPLRDSGGGGGTTNGVLSSAAADSFGFGRFNMIRYISPKLGPFTVSAEHANNEQWGAGVTVATSFAGAKVGAGLTYWDAENNSGFDQLNASASVAFSQGTNVGLMWKEKNMTGGLNRHFWQAKIGHKWGNNSVSLAYYDGADMAVANDDSSEWKVAFVHSIPKPRVHLYAVYSNLDYNHPTIATEDVDTFFVGSRIFF